MLTIHVDLPDAAYEPLKDLLTTTSKALSRDLRLLTTALETETHPEKIGNMKTYGEKTTKQLLIINGLLQALPAEGPPPEDTGLIITPGQAKASPAGGGRIDDLLAGAGDWRPGQARPLKKGQRG